MCLKFEDTTQNFSLCRDNADQPWSTTGFKHFIFWQTQIADQQINKSIIYIFYYHEENVKKHYPNKQIKIEHYCTLMYIIMCCIMWHIVVYFYGYLQFIIFNSSSFFWTLSSLNTTHFECQWPTKKNAIENPPVDPLFFFLYHPMTTRSTWSTWRTWRAWRTAPWASHANELPRVPWEEKSGGFADNFCF